jgi:hypothetical protein
VKVLGRVAMKKTWTAPTVVELTDAKDAELLVTFQSDGFIGLGLSGGGS